MAFRKNHERSLDTKGRLMLPVDYRESIATSSPHGYVVLTANNGCLVAYLPEDWEKIREELDNIVNPSPNLSRFASKFLGSADEVTPDAQGRVRISQRLMRAAGLTKDIVLVARRNRFEIWDQVRLDAIEFESVSEELAMNNIKISI